MPKRYRVVELFWHDNIFAKFRTKMTTVSRFSRQNTEFKIYDATVTKTSFKIASSGLLIFFRDYVGLSNF